MLNRAFVLPVLVWMSLVVTGLLIRASLVSAPVQPTEYVLWLLALSAPISVVWMLMRALPSRSIGQIIFDNEQTEARVPVAPTDRNRTSQR